LRYIKMAGRVQLDLYNYFRREENLSSYKLDAVAGHFIGDYVKSIEKCGASNKTVLGTSNVAGLHVGSYIHIEEIGHTSEYYKDGAKFEVIAMNATSLTIRGDCSPDMSKKIRWCMAKDDVTPKDIFRLTNGNAADRAKIAKYCIQDCTLVLQLLRKVELLTGFIEMATICSVPISFLVLRGQGIKLTSYVAKKCRERDTLMPVLEKEISNDGYEGAIVLDPKCDLYLDNPVACVDYASLYPSCMMSENLSHDSKVWTMEYDLEGNLLKVIGEQCPRTGEFLYDGLEGIEYVNVRYDTFQYVRKTPSAAAIKVKSGYKVCRWAQPRSNGSSTSSTSTTSSTSSTFRATTSSTFRATTSSTFRATTSSTFRAIMPSILEELLSARKATRKKIPLETDEFMKNVLDKRQLGYKVTANSLYGQCGAKTSTFYDKDVAASTTATGRLLLIYAKETIESMYGDTICDTLNDGQVHTAAEYIYGDTDSVFFTFNLSELDGTPIRGQRALAITIELAQHAGRMASMFLKPPHDLEYEKTFMPFCLLSKKRYVGMLFEHDPNPAKGKRKEMGIVLKRRDNAPIVKDVYGGIIDILMKEQDIGKAVMFLQTKLQDIVDERCSMDKLVITKSLRSGYAKPQQIAHNVLAQRMAQRDPGSKPSSGDRIAFVYVHNPNKKALQGERIETPTYIIDNRLRIDYSFYITNQIMKPVQQLFALVLDRVWMHQQKLAKISKFRQKVQLLQHECMETGNMGAFQTKLEALKCKAVKETLFDDFLRTTNNSKEGNRPITDYFKGKMGGSSSKSSYSSKGKDKKK